jgi:hypothetical protein
MAVPVKKLIEILNTKNPKDEVEFVVVRTDGALMTMDLSGPNVDLTKILKLFTPKKASK